MIKRKVIILRALPYGKDSRVSRWAMIYKNYTPIYGVWGESKDSAISITNIKKSSNKILNIFFFMWFCIKCFFFLLKHANKNDVVVFIDLETILFGFLGALLKGAKIHYDMADPFYLNKPMPGKRIWKFIEKLFVRYSPLVTAPHELRLLLFSNKIRDNMMIVENVPIFYNLDRGFEYLASKNLRIGYFGMLEKNVRGLENIVEFVKSNLNFELIVAGSGELKNYFIENSNICKRITFIENLEYNQLPNFMKKIDIYYAYYSSSKYLHHIAAPNKYYEHLFFGVPILTSKIIPQSILIEENKTGWCVDNNLEEILNEIYKQKDNLNIYRNKCLNVWQKEYLDYYENIKTNLFFKKEKLF